MPRTRTSRPRRPRALVLLTALIAAAALVVPTTGASAARPAPTPTPAKITVTPVSNIGPLPDALGTPKVLIKADQPATVTVALTGGVYSKTTDLPLTLTATNGSFVQTTPVTIAANTSSKDLTLTLGTSSRVVLTAMPVDRKAERDLGSGSSLEFDVVKDPQTVKPVDRTQPLLVSRAGNGLPCEPTPGNPTCVDLVLPKGVGSDIFFATGACDGGVNCGRNGIEVLQVLAKIEGPYQKTSPATLVVKCDKSLCGGGAIQRNVLYASLEKTGPLAPVSACAAKGVIDPDVTPDDPTDTEIESCVDYVQSKRDGSGDTYLYWLITRDARMSF